MIDELDRILAAGGDADDVLRDVVRALVDHGCSWARISYRGEQVGELAADGLPDRVELQRVAALVSEHVLLGWDTGGEGWAP